jgi:hypothetical protein
MPDQPANAALHLLRRDDRIELSLTSADKAV